MCHVEVIQRVRWAQIGLGPGREPVGRLCLGHMWSKSQWKKFCPFGAAVPAH